MQEENILKQSDGGIATEELGGTCSCLLLPHILKPDNTLHMQKPLAMGPSLSEELSHCAR